MQISRALAIALPLLAVQAPVASAAPQAHDCAAFKSADGDLATLAGALRTVASVVSGDASNDEKREAAQTTGEALVKTSDILADVASNVSDDYRPTVSDFSAAVKELGGVIETVDGAPDEATTHKAQEIAKRVDSLSGDYDKAHNAACAA